MLKGYALATFSTFTAALTAVMVKMLIVNVDPLVVNATIYTSALLLSTTYFLVHKSKPYVSVRSLISGLSLSLYGALLYLSFAKIKVSVGGLAISLFPVFTTVLAKIMGERLEPIEVLALALSSISLLSVSFVSDPQGLVLATLASLSLSAYTLLLKGEPPEAFHSVLLSSSLASWAYVIIMGVPINPSAIKAISLGALSFIGTLAWVKAVNEIGASRSSVTALTYPFFVLILSVLALGEEISVSEALAYSLATVSLLLVIRKGR